MPERLAPFELERWLRRQEKVARFAIGGSGVPQADLAPFVPADVEPLWRTHPDAANQALRDAVAAQWRVSPEEVVPTVGASEADMLVALGLAGPGAHVLVERPAYHALLQPARALGCRVTRVERRAANGFRLDPGEVARAIGPDTRLVCLARPNNPTGAREEDAALAEIAQAAERVGAHVLVDEVFADATEAGARPARAAHPRVISVNSLTKCLGFSPLRVGWAIVADAAAREAIDRAKGVASAANASLNLLLGARILDARPRLLSALRGRRAANVRLAERFAAETKAETTLPGAGTTCVVRLPPGAPEDITFAQRLADERGLVLPPGSFVEMPGWLRLGLVGPTATLEQGLAELRDAWPSATRGRD
ncbi:MAG: hypothetical protein QOE90_580 [Thermoplasmata archaeon]|jgi:aspartate/methionine/tyrosine aminotransferase|nr:hypothetical protein [Thermoplasmata archaeon]